MKKRALGIETEYSVALRNKDSKEFYTGLISMPPTRLLTELFPIVDSVPKRLRELCFFPPEGSDYLWLGSNGARFYFDNSSVVPEYATPECASVREVILHHFAGDILLEALRQEVLRQGLLQSEFEGLYDDIYIFKVNSSFNNKTVNSSEKIGRPLSVGCHENYLVPGILTEAGGTNNRFAEFCSYMGPFFGTRQIFDGAGGIVKDPKRGWQYVVSSRSFFIEHVWSDDTTGGQFGRGTFNFRNTGVSDYSGDECLPGTDRLHVLCGDHAMSPWGKYIAVGATHLALRAFEEGDAREWKYGKNDNYWRSDFHAVAADPRLKTRFRVKNQNGSERSLLAVDLQAEYAEFVARTLTSWLPEERELFKAWTGMIETLRNNPEDASRELDWLIKLNYLRARHDGNFASPKARFASVLYHDVADRGIYNKFLETGLVRKFAEKSEIAASLAVPPETRAKLRSRYIKLLYNETEMRAGINGWGIFAGLLGEIRVRDPFATTTEEIEALFKSFKDRTATGT